MIEVHFGDNLEVLAGLPDGLARLVYVDPPFNKCVILSATADWDGSTNSVVPAETREASKSASDNTAAV